MQAKHSGVLLLLLTLLGACSNQSSAEETKELQTVSSWAATANMTGDAWIRGHVPTVYAKRTLQKAQEEIKKETIKLNQQVTAQNKRQLLEQLNNINQTIGQISTAVAEENRNVVIQQIKQLLIEKRAIDALTKSTGKKP